MALAVVIGGSMFSVQHAHADIAPLRNSNVIMYGGFSSPSNFISKVKTGASGNGHNDLQAIYAHYGLTASQYDRFVNEAVQATVYRDGRVVVGGKTVATNGQNLGREQDTQGNGAYAVNIGSTTYWANANSRTYRADQDSLNAYVLLDKYGQMEFGTIAACGNPVWGTVVKTTAACSMLNATPVGGKLNTYDFTATASVSGNASITKYVFDFGDGSPTQTYTSSQVVRHTYTKTGSFNAKVTVYASVPGNSNLQLPAVATCTKPIVITLPACVNLTGAILDKSKFMYSFVAKASFGSGVTFKSADFVFGDGNSQNGVVANGTTASVNHSYAQAGKYNVAATLHFSVNGADYTAPTCTASVTPEQPPTPTCKPGVPVGSPLCSPCEFDTSLPSDSPDCKPPVLPDTGAGNVIALISAAVIGGFLVYRQLLFRKHKRAFMAAQMGTSPLPLADPLNEGTTTVGTPAERPKASRFRRKRPF
jgi:hypothetical protein